MRAATHARRLSIAAILILACISPAAAESSGGTRSEGAAGPDDATIDRLLKLHYTQTETVPLVLLPTSVTTRKGRVVRDLGQRDFKVFEDSVPQEIRFFSSETNEPISLAFLLDVSGSMRQVDKLVHAKEAVRHFVDNLQKDDRFALVCFADQQVSWVTEFTQDRKRFLRRLDVQEGYGQTALNDAVAATPELVDEKGKGRKAIVLITDGVDNRSHLSMWEAVKQARRVSVPVYTLGFLSLPEESLPKNARTNLHVLEQVAVETGGKLFLIHSPIELKEAIAELQAELRFQYVIGYYPIRRVADGKFRRVRLEVDSDRLDVRTRRGYYAKP
jgi:Ca-activated chloride channel family protein